MIWSIDFDDETGIGLENPNGYKSPESATVIPMAHTTVPRGQTFTVGPGASSDIPKLPNDGNQNTPQGPGASSCQQCSFFRLITSTCCGTGGSVGNPITIPAGVPTPMDIPLPAGFIPNQAFTDPYGNIIPANQPLPKETTIPKGTTFTQLFLIPSGISLREGEGDDQNSNSSSLIWLSPETWNRPDPQVQCFFPCTFVLPPYPGFTTTIDYPLITVTESGTVKTTLTFPPLTISTWLPSTIVVRPPNRCTATSCASDNDNRRTSSVDISTTTIWPPVTFTTSGTVSTTRPPSSTGGGIGLPCLWPLCPPGPPPALHPPHITISFGPPKPITTKCAFPALDCPPPPARPPFPGIPWVPPPGAPPLVPEKQANPDEICFLDPTTSRTLTSTVSATATSTSTVFTSDPIPTVPMHTWNQPDWSKDENKCYNSGQVALRKHLITPVDEFCAAYKGQHLSPGWFSGTIRSSFPCCDKNNEVVPIAVEVSLEMKDGCEWDFDEGTCRTEMRKVIDQCDKDGENRKQGGRVVGNCVIWRVDPQTA